MSSFDSVYLIPFTFSVHQPINATCARLQTYFVTTRTLLDRYEVRAVGLRGRRDCGRCAVVRSAFSETALLGPIAYNTVGLFAWLKS